MDDESKGSTKQERSLNLKPGWALSLSNPRWTCLRIQLSVGRLTEMKWDWKETRTLTNHWPELLTWKSGARNPAGVNQTMIWLHVFLTSNQYIWVLNPSPSLHSKLQCLLPEAIVKGILHCPKPGSLNPIVNLEVVSVSLVDFNMMWGSKSLSYSFYLFILMAQIQLH